MGFRKKANTSSPGALNSWLLFGILSLLALAFVIYSFVYVKNNEEEQIAKNFRVLARISDNIAKKENRYRNIAESWVNASLKKDSFDRDPDSQTNHLIESIEKRLRDAGSIVNIAGKYRVKGNSFLKFSGFNMVTNTGISKDYVLYSNTADFFAPLNDPDVFDGLIVVKGKDITYSLGKIEKNDKSGAVANLYTIDNSVEPVSTSPAGGDAKSYEVLFHSFPGGIDVSKIEEMRNKTGSIESGSLHDIQVSHKKYKLFFQPLILKNGNKWYVGGLSDLSKFTRKNRAMNNEILIPGLIVFIILILAVPLLKLFFMSTFDQLNINDAVLAFFSITLGVLMIVLLCLSSFQRLKDSECIDSNLTGLAGDINSRFTSELQMAYRQLKTLDSTALMYNSGLSSGFSVSNILGRPRAANLASALPVVQKDLSPEFFSVSRDYNLFKVVFWLDFSGRQTLQLSTRNYLGDLSALGHRDYFRNAGNWNLPGIPGARFMLNSITSVTSGEKLAAISVESALLLKSSREDDVGNPRGLNWEKTAVAAMTSQLTSLIDTVMPPGYGFSIIDASGKTWFHSDSERNLKENFISEADNNSHLLSAIYANRNKHLHLDYHGKENNCYIMPVPDIPLFIITFHDKARSDSLQVYIIMDTLLHMLALLLFIILLFLISAGLDFKKSLLRKRYIPFEWFRPVEEKENTYRILIVINFLIIALLVLVKTGSRNFPGEGVATIYLCAAAILVAFLTCYSSLIRKGARLQQYLPAGTISLAKVIKDRAYSFYLLSWLVLVCVVPATLFYIDAYNYENEIALKFRQTEIAANITARNFRIDSLYKEKMDDRMINKGLQKTKEIRKTTGIYCYNSGKSSVSNLEAFAAADDIPTVDFNYITYFVRLLSDGADIKKKDLAFPASSDGCRSWRRNNNLLLLKYKIKESLNNIESGANKEFLVIQSEAGGFPVPQGYALILPVVVIVSVLVLFYFLIRFAAKMILGRDLLAPSLNEPGVGEKSGRRIYNETRDFVDAGSNLVVHCQTEYEMDSCCKLFRVASSGKKSAAKNDDTIAVNLVDHNSEDKVFEDIGKNTNTKLVLKNFDKMMERLEKDPLKIKVLFDWLNDPRRQVIFLTITPLSELIEDLSALLPPASSSKSNQAAFEKRGFADDAQLKSTRNTLKLLKEARECSVSVYIPLEFGDDIEYSLINGIIKDTEAGKKVPDYNKKKKIRDLILKEFRGSGFYTTIERSVYRYYNALWEKGDPEIEEKLIIKIQTLSRNYYSRLLKACSGKEIFVLYDIAHDMLVNYNNKETLEILVKKGLLLYDGSFEFMNESFRNYILSTIGSDLAKRQMLVDLSFQGRWKIYRAPIFLVILGLAVFFTFQESLMGNLNALITTLVGGFAILSKVTGLFSNFSFNSNGKK
ncbi:MAG: hypothetical protein GY757_61640 [bacterium]|nr:hypothetical protein [bacterium]